MPARKDPSEQAIAQFNLQLEKTLLEDARKLAEAKGVTLSAFVRELIEQAVNDSSPPRLAREKVLKAARQQRQDLVHELRPPEPGRTIWRLESSDIFGNSLSSPLPDDEIKSKDDAEQWLADYLKRVTNYLGTPHSN